MAAQGEESVREPAKLITVPFEDPLNTTSGTCPDSDIVRNVNELEARVVDKQAGDETAQTEHSVAQFEDIAAQSRDSSAQFMGDGAQPRAQAMDDSVKAVDNATQSCNGIAQSTEGEAEARVAVAQSGNDTVQAKDDALQDTDDPVQDRDGAAQDRNDAAQDRDDGAQDRDGVAQARDDAAQDMGGAAQNRDGAAQARDDAAQDMGGAAQNRDGAAQVRDNAEQAIEDRQLQQLAEFRPATPEPTMQQRIYACMADPRKSKPIRRQLMTFLHAEQCLRRDVLFKGKLGVCDLGTCKIMKDVVTHLESHDSCDDCEFPYLSSRIITNHWRSCRDLECLICVPVRRRCRLKSIMTG